MDKEWKKRVRLGGIVITAFITVVILAAIPVLQLLVIYRLTGIDGLKAYLPAGSPAFYQFILTCFAVLAAVAGYLTYKSREEARQEIERIKEETKKETERIKIELEKKLNEIDEYCKRKMNEIEIQCVEVAKSMAEKAETARETIERAQEAVKRAAEEKTAAIAGIQLPKPGKTDKERLSQEMYKKGIKAYDDKNFDEAIDYFSTAILLNPDNADAYYYRGLSHYEKGDFDPAIDNFNEMKRSNPKDIWAYIFLGLTRIEKGDLNDAIADYNKAISLDKNNAFSYYGLACIYAKKKDIKQCEVNLKMAIKLDNDFLDMAKKEKYFGPVRNSPEIKAILG